MQLSSKYATFEYCKYQKLMTCKELLKILKADGWEDVKQVGSHLQLKHPTKAGKVTLPIRSGDVPKGTLNSILKQAGLK